MSATVLSEALFCPLMVLHLALWIAAWQSLDKNRAAWLAAGAGLAAGAAALARPSWLLFAPVVVLLAAAVSSQRRRHLGIGSVMLAACAAAMLSWWIRNYLVIGRFVPTTLQVGASLYDGWNPQATGASDLSLVDRFVREEAARPAAGAAPLEYRLDRRLRDEATTWARANPGRVAKLAAVKFLRIWNVWPNEPGLSSWPIRLGLMATYVPIMILAVVGAARTIRRGWPYLLCWLPAVYLTGLHTIFVGSIRYRVPAMLALAVLAAGAGIGGQASGCRVQDSVRQSTGLRSGRACPPLDRSDASGDADG